MTVKVRGGMVVHIKPCPFCDGTGQVEGVMSLWECQDCEGKGVFGDYLCDCNECEMMFERIERSRNEESYDVPGLVRA